MPATCRALPYLAGCVLTGTGSVATHSVVASRNVMYYDFAVRPPPIPAAASRLPVFSDEAMESDAPDEMQPAHAEADLFEEDDDE